MLNMSHDVFLAYLPIDPLEKAPKSPKLLTVQVRTHLRQSKIEPHVTSKLQIISASHFNIPRPVTSTLLHIAVLYAS